MALTETLPLPRLETRVIGLVSGAHFFSHFYMLLLPPLFPLLRDVYGVGYTELGLALTAFSLTTGIAQTPVGFMVDRYGARLLLVTGLLLQTVAFGVIAVMPMYTVLVAAMVLGGLGNAVYHPADYSILNARVDGRRMGRAFSLHTAAGHFGSAVAPATILTLTATIGWRYGLALCTLGGIAMLVWLCASRRALEAPKGDARVDAPAIASAPSRRNVALLLSMPVLSGLLFFFGTSIAGRGVSEFGVAALDALYDVPLTTLGATVTAFLVASPIGVLIGGVIADRVERRHDLVATLCFVVFAVSMYIAAAFEMPLVGLMIVFFVAGLVSGIVAPSRDMMIRSVTPPGQMGKVFGFVSTGFNLAGVVGPVLYGYILDNYEPRHVLYVVAAFGAANIALVLSAGYQGRRARSAGVSDEA